MASITSPGLASGIDIKSIVSQLVALERAPLQPLQRQASTFQSKISILSTIKSSIDNLGTLAAKLGDPANWSGFNATSSNAAEVAVSATSTATAGRFSLSVASLASSQSAASGVLNTANGLGTGTLSFSVAGGAVKDIEILAGEDSPAAIAAKINSSDVGVTATVLKDASGERIIMRGKETGALNTFTVAVAGGNADGLQKLAFGGAAVGGMTQAQAAANAKFSIDGVALESASNELADTVPGLTLTLKQPTTAAVDINVASDTDGMKKNIQAFVDAYNALNSLLAEATKYDAATKQGGLLQGDSFAIGIQNAMRGILQSTESEELIDIEINEEEPAFLRGQTKMSKELSPVRIVKNPDGSLQRAALQQSQLSKERRELKQAQTNSLIDAIPKDLSKPWEDPMPQVGERHFAQELKCAGYTVRYTKLDDPHNQGSLRAETARALEDHAADAVGIAVVADAVGNDFGNRELAVDRRQGRRQYLDLSPAGFRFRELCYSLSSPRDGLAHQHNAAGKIYV